MILQALYEYYQRKRELREIPGDGFTKKGLDYLVILNKDGEYVDIESQLESDGKTKKTFLVPVVGKQAEKHSNSGTDANLLWDKAEFALGVGGKGNTKLESFIKTIFQYYPEDARPYDIGAVLAFLVKVQREPDSIRSITHHSEYGKIISEGSPNITFKILGEPEPIVHQKHANDALLKFISNEEKKGVCLITGETNVTIEINHTVTKGITGAKSAGANLVSFNNPAYCSYNKARSFNAPVSKKAASAYTKALKHLIDSDTNVIKVGDSTTIFWAEKKAASGDFDLEENFKWYVEDRDDPDRGVRAVKALYESFQSGKTSADEGNRFYVLGLSPNAARIAVRFWKRGTVSEFGKKIKQHFDDLDIFHIDFEPSYCTLNAILSSIAVETKDTKKPNRVYFHGRFYDVPPNLAGKVVESILDGTPYPDSLLNLCINRIRAEASKKDQKGRSIPNVTRTRAAVLKACLERKRRLQSFNIKEVKMSWDWENKDIGYLLGGLFAVLEKVQEKAAGGKGKLNTTIRDRYYGAFSSAPVTVLPILMKLKNHHMGKKDINFKWHEDLIGRISNEIDAKRIPAHMSLQEQAQFAIGYYHMRYYGG